MCDRRLCRKFGKDVAQSIVVDQCKYAAGKYFINAVISVDCDMDIIHDSVHRDGDAETRD